MAAAAVVVKQLRDEMKLVGEDVWRVTAAEITDWLVAGRSNCPVGTLVTLLLGVPRN